MSDEPIRRDSRVRQCLKAAAWACIVIALVGDFTGLLDRVVPPQSGMLLSRMGIALVMLAYRRPGLTGWGLVLLGWVVVAAATYHQLSR
jgi:hypothetical protein